MRVFAKLTVTELRLLLREPVAAFFVLLFPTVLVIILGSIPSFRRTNEDYGARPIDLYVGIAVILTLAMAAIQVTPAVLALYRERGVLRRLATTPVSPLKMLAAQLASNGLAAIAATALVLAVGRIVFDVPLAGNVAGFVLAFLLTAAGTLAIGLFVAAVAPSGKAGSAIGTLLFFPLMFFAGLWLPREAMPGVLQRVADFTPLGAGERALNDAMTGSWPNLLSATVLVGYLAVFGSAAVRMFRWQ
ncbi:ABC transporter permease [Paractinoplanes brasiliensis]|uniref:Transport permease protein n=1 Tax=Paractinoplanes brasiliensis TaxID=52695 RepID=A0A4R6K001_9ACTN|nr:ABC transporter permease [Actinoplanes brasiliensis]TDO41512.1 ABC-2 type transport system permease protein [Actinoplanes brasiliensis]GID27201.1 transport permease protein [Actinoplanes brasiliensis]